MRNAELHDSLDFAERNQRYERITEAHPTTFNWIFEKSELGLISWLRKGTGIYWIQGKPGSGKSTLMKFLHDHPQTSEILSHWRQGRDHTSAWFFFNERGSYIEKSFEGLFRSIIGEMVSRNEWLAELVLEVYLKRLKHPFKEKQTWPLQDLERALSAILSQRERDLEVLLFLDALDEYSGSPEMIADFVQSLVQPVPDSKTKVRVLLSSRPWDAFVASFSQQPGFKMHEQTKGDMRVFVLDQLGTTHAMARPSTPVEASLNPTARDVVSTIVDRAEGVFLWVRLVIKSLLGAGPDATTLQVKELLEALPDGLEELYERTIERIPQSCRLEAFVVLEIVNHTDHTLDVWEVTDAASCALGETVEECVGMTKRSPRMNEEQATLQLKNLCGGLIETYLTRVQFMHQTVKDFVSRPGFEHRMLGRSYAPLHENGFSFLMKFELAFPERFGIGSAPACVMARRAEETTGNNQEKFLDSVGDERISDLLSWSRNRPISVLSFAVLANLLLYIKQKFRTTNLVDGALHRSLLHFLADSIYIGHPPSSLASMAEFLFEKGADINYKFAGKTPFEYLFNEIWSQEMREMERWPLSKFYWECAGKVVQVFLEHGQDANIDIRDIAHPDAHGINYACKPLHIARNAVSKTLLEHGAQVNALDSRGLTPLDRVIRDPNRTPYDDRIHLTASILLEYGGCITHSTKKSLPYFIDYMSIYVGEIPANFRNLPELPPTLTQRVRRILPAYLGGA